MDTKTLALTSLLDCGYADLCMLDILYSPLADEINLDGDEILRESTTEGGGLNYVLDRAYSYITSYITDRLNELVDEYENTLDEDGNIIEEETRYAEICDMLEDITYNEDKCIGLTEEQLETIKDKISDMEDSYPFTNYLDTHFQNDLDQTLDEESGVDENCRLLLEYWLR